MVAMRQNDGLAKGTQVVQQDFPGYISDKIKNVI